MIDLTQLPPAEMARHLGRPDGEVGLAVGERLNRVNENITAEAYRRLRLRTDMHVMEIGFGNGHLLPDLLRQAPGLLYNGIDISPTMVDEARRFNAALVNEGRAAFHLADAARIPAADASFDRVFAVNVIYFWSDPVVPLREIRRVLRPSGVSLITAVTPETVAGNEVFRGENGFHARDADMLVALHRQSGFGDVRTELVTEVASRVDGTPWTRHYNFLHARP
jgi:ubiquinone/menaquinone biosynthesis C-methylase UbiE